MEKVGRSQNPLRLIDIGFKNQDDNLNLQGTLSECEDTIDVLSRLRLVIPRPDACRNALKQNGPSQRKVLTVPKAQDLV
jgi:hypothetical protein